MRKKLYGFYKMVEAILVFIFEDEDGNEVFNFKHGDVFEIDSLRYYIGKRGDRLFIAAEGQNEEISLNIEYLYDKQWYLMATSAQQAKKAVLKEYKPVNSKDPLVQTLEKIGFQPQCLKVKKDLTEIEYPSNFNPECPNYSYDKAWYSYKVVTDATDVSTVRVVCGGCPSCARYNECKAKKKEMRRTYDAFYNGTYVFVIRTNMRTGEKSLQEIEITKEVNKMKLISIIEENFKEKKEVLPEYRKNYNDYRKLVDKDVEMLIG